MDSVERKVESGNTMFLQGHRSICKFDKSISLSKADVLTSEMEPGQSCDT